MQSLSERKAKKETKELLTNIEENTGVSIETKKKSDVVPMVHMLLGSAILIGAAWFLPTVIYLPLCLVWLISGVFVAVR